MAEFENDPYREGLTVPSRLSGNWTFVPTFYAQSAYLVGGTLTIPAATTVGAGLNGTLSPGMTVNGSGLAPGTIVAIQVSATTFRVRPGSTDVPGAPSASIGPIAISAGFNLLPLIPTLPNGMEAWCTDIQAIATWNSATQTWGANNSPAPLRYSRPVTVAAIGDSITQKNQLIFDTATNTPAQLYAATQRAFQAQSWLAYGAMRSNRAWMAWDFNPGQTGGRADQVLSIVLPCFLSNPGGLPDACIVQAGTNDVGQATPIATTIASLKGIYSGLQAAGVMPIMTTVPPTVANQAACMQLNLAIQQLSRELKLPLIDWWSALVNPATGAMNTNYSVDGTHPTPRGAAIMGYKVNETVIAAFGLSRSRSTVDTWAAGLALNLANADPLFQTFTGTINTASSYPNAGVWYGPSYQTAANCTMNNGAGTEPGTGLTMEAPTPALAGDSSTPNYVGNSFTITGDGTHNFTANYLTSFTHFLNYNVGDRIRLTFRLKTVFSQAAASPAIFECILNDSNLGSMMGFYGGTSTVIVTNQIANIGDEAGYPAGDFCQEITVPAGAGFGQWSFFFTNAANSHINSGDSLVIANLQALNLTQLGIVSP